VQNYRTLSETGVRKNLKSGTNYLIYKHVLFNNVLSLYRKQLEIYTITFR